MLSTGRFGLPSLMFYDLRSVLSDLRPSYRAGMRKERKGPLGAAAGLAEDLAAPCAACSATASRACVLYDVDGPRARAPRRRRSGTQHARRWPRAWCALVRSARRSDRPPSWPADAARRAPCAAAATSPSCTWRSAHGLGLTLDDGRVERPRAAASWARRSAGGGRRLDLLRPRGRPRRGRPPARGGLGVPGGVAATRREPAGAGRDRRARRGATRSAAPPEDVDAARKAELLRASATRRARARGRRGGPGRRRLRASTRRRVEVFNSDGVAAADDRTRVRLGVQVVARRNGRVETGSETRGGHAGFELIEERPRGGGGVAPPARR